MNLMQYSAREYYNSFFNKKEALGLTKIENDWCNKWQNECLIIHLLWKALGKQEL